MWCILVCSPLWLQPFDFCHSIAFQFCLLGPSLLTWQSNFLSLLHHSSSYISLLSPRRYWSKNETEINPELRRPQTLTFTIFAVYHVWMHLMPLTGRMFWKGSRAVSQTVISTSLCCEGVTMGREDKPVIKILQLCFPHPFLLPPTLWALFSAVLSIGSLY